MGLIKAIFGSALGTIADEWLEYIYCDSLTDDVLMQKGHARVGNHSGNTDRDSNIISDGSKIAVNEGQCMLVVENGKIIDFCAEPGGYLYNTGTEPSLFDDSEYWLKESFQKMGQRFKSGGQAMNDQRVYFVNKKEILNNKVGVGEVPFRDGEFNLTLMLKAFGTYTFRIKDPIVFYTNICANVPEAYMKSSLERQLREEMQSVLIPQIGKLGTKKISYDQIPLMTEELVVEMNRSLNEKWREKRGIEIDTLVLTKIVPDEASVEKIRELQESSVYAGQTRMLGARIGAASASAMEDAANNTGGAVTGFMGMNMAMGAGGINANELLSSADAQPEAEGRWKCECGTENDMLFCAECGRKRPQTPVMWKCECGFENKGKFCVRCGKAKPKRYICDKCGYALEFSSMPPKFCPQCGDPIDEKDEASG